VTGLGILDGKKGAKPGSGNDEDEALSGLGQEVGSSWGLAEEGMEDDDPILKDPLMSGLSPARRGGNPDGLDEPLETVSGKDLDPREEAELYLYRRSVTIVGKYHFKDVLKVKEGQYGEIAMFSILIKHKTKRGIRSGLLYVKTFRKHLIRFLRELPNDTFVKVYGDLDIWLGKVCINAKEIMPVFDVGQVMEETSDIADEAASDMLPEDREEIEALRNSIRHLPGQDGVVVDGVVIEEDPDDEGEDQARNGDEPGRIIVDGVQASEEDAGPDRLPAPGPARFVSGTRPRAADLKEMADQLREIAIQKGNEGENDYGEEEDLDPDLSEDPPPTQKKPQEPAKKTPQPSGKQAWNPGGRKKSGIFKW
jgi:hypothetical protein